MKMLANKHKYIYNSVEYLIDVGKSFYGNVLGDDHYVYYVDIFSTEYKLKPWYERLFSKEKYVYNCLFEYKTDWVKCYRYEGDVDKVIIEAFNKHSKNIKELKYATKKENEWQETYNEKYKEQLYSEFYDRVIRDLKEKGLINKELCEEQNRSNKIKDNYPWN